MPIDIREYEALISIYGLPTVLTESGAEKNEV